MDNQKKIIIAEDDPAMQDVIDLIFQRAGYQVTLFSDGEALMNLDFERPDIFILDKQLSGVDGLDICKLLKSNKETRELPVIMLSANPQIGKMSAEAGADGWLEKPFRLSALLEMVQQLTNIPEDNT